MTNFLSSGAAQLQSLCRSCIVCGLCVLCSGPVLAQTQLADTIIDAFYSGAHPGFNSFYGQVDRCDEYTVNPTVCLGSNDTLLALPTGSYVTVGFIDNLIYNAPNQPDLFVDETGPSDEFAEIYISSDFGQSFTFFGIVNGGTTNALDLEDISYTDCINAVKIVGLDNNGCIPGFDVVRVYGISGASIEPIPRTNAIPVLCTDSGPYALRTLEAATARGQWAGPHVQDNMFMTAGVRGTFQLEYWITENLTGCDQDTALVTLQVEICDCAGTPLGDAVIDNCGECYEPVDPLFNYTCIPKETFIPNVFSPNSDGVNDIFPMFLANDLTATISAAAIFDRFGNQVAGLSDISIFQEQPLWDGMIKGRPAPTGVYVYYVLLDFIDGVQLKLHGDVTLIR